MERLLIIRLLPLFLAIAIDIMGFGLVQPVMTAMFSEVHTSVLPIGTPEAMRYFYLGLGYLLYPLFMFFGASLLGDLSDNIGRKKTLILCLFGLFVGYIGMAAGVFWGQLWIFFIGRAFTGLLSGCQPVAQATIADLSPPEDKAKNMGFIVFVVSAGLLFGPLIGGFFSDSTLVPFFGFWTPYFIVSLLSLVSAIWIFVSYPESYEVHQHVPFDPLRPARIFIMAFQLRPLRLLVPLFLCMQIGLGIYYQYVLVEMQVAYKYSSFYLGAFSGWMGVFFTLSLLLVLPKLVARFYVEHLAIVALLVCGIFIIFGSIVHHQIYEWIMAAVVAFTNNIAYAMIMTTFSNQVDQTRQGWVNGVFISTMALGFCLNALAANLIPVIGVMGVIFIGGILYTFSGLLMLVFCLLFPLKGIPKSRETQ